MAGLQAAVGGVCWPVTVRRDAAQTIGCDWLPGDVGAVPVVSVVDFQQTHGSGRSAASWKGSLNLVQSRAFEHDH